MSTVATHLRSIDGAVCDNIEALSANRGLLSQNILQQLRHLVEGVAVLAHTSDPEQEFDYAAITAGMTWVRTQGRLSFLHRFHRLLQPSTSHYTFDEDGSERLMLKYYAHLVRIRSYLADAHGLAVLANLETFPVDLDPSLQEYQEKIVECIEAGRGTPSADDTTSRFYVLKTRPFFVGGRIYYEVTFCLPSDKVSKFDRIIAFTDQDVSDRYAASLTLRSESIEVLGQRMPITIIQSWEVSIRPCELQNFARYFGPAERVNSGGSEYRRLMRYLTVSGSTLLDIVEFGKCQGG